MNEVGMCVGRKRNVAQLLLAIVAFVLALLCVATLVLSCFLDVKDQSVTGPRLLPKVTVEGGLR